MSQTETDATQEPILTCPIHGEVEGFFETEGPIADAYPYPVLCEECDPVQTIIGFEDTEGRPVDAGGSPIFT